MKNSSFTILGGFIAAAVIALPGSAIAISALPAYTSIHGDGGMINVGEANIGNGNIAYQVDVLGAGSLYGLAISYVTDGSAGISYTLGWSASHFSETQWNDSRTSFSFVVADDQETSVSTSALGSFDSLFGTSDNEVAVFVRSIPSDPAITDANDHDFANWSTTSQMFGRAIGGKSSEFIALGGTGQIVDGSVVALPEPTTLSLGAAAIGYLGLRRRRRVNASSR